MAPNIRVHQVPAAQEKVIFVARHEIGHLIVARALGFETGNCTITVSLGGGRDPIGHHGSSQISLVAELPIATRIRDYLERRIQVCFAGALAESLKDDGTVDVGYADNELLFGGATQDLKVVSELRCLLRNIVHPEILPPEAAAQQVQGLSDELWGRTIGLVKEYCDVIKGVAGNLANRVTHLDQPATITGKEIDVIPMMKQFMKELGRS
jgi:hypothetical protein